LRATRSGARSRDPSAPRDDPTREEHVMPVDRLHYFPESGNSYKLALMLTLCGQSFEPVWTDFGGGITRTAEWRRTVNPMGEIPYLKKTVSA
jgi:hypothetical protein